MVFNRRSGLKRARPWWHWMAWAFFFVYVIIPVSVYIFPGIVSTMVFSTAAFYFRDLRNPEEAGLLATRHLDLTLPSGEKLGVWHILPDSDSDEQKKYSDEEYDKKLRAGTPVIIYHHGNGGTRGQSSRVKTYSVLRGMAHVITFDYRGYGDSDGEATEKNMVYDAVAVYDWVKGRAKSAPVYLWGHSLGSGVAVQAARQLTESEKDGPLKGVILEGAFNNMSDLLEAYLLMLPFRPFPFLMRLFRGALRSRDVYFNTDEHLTRLQCPVLMLHAEDDMVVPHDQAVKLFQAGMRSVNVLEGKLKIDFRTFPAEKGYGHNNMNGNPELGHIVSNFVKESLHLPQEIHPS